MNCCLLILIPHHRQSTVDLYPSLPMNSDPSSSVGLDPKLEKRQIKWYTVENLTLLSMYKNNSYNAESYGVAN